MDPKPYSNSRTIATILSDMESSGPETARPRKISAAEDSLR